MKEYTFSKNQLLFSEPESSISKIVIAIFLDNFGGTALPIWIKAAVLDDSK